jgi:hypothetical protein
VEHSQHCPSGHRDNHWHHCRRPGALSLSRPI